MTKSDLAAKVAETLGMTKKDAEAAVAATFNAITEELKNSGKVQLTGFGTFSTKDRPARTCISPSTKQKVNVPATTVPVFKAGKALKDEVAK